MKKIKIVKLPFVPEFNVNCNFETSEIDENLIKNIIGIEMCARIRYTYIIRIGDLFIKEKKRILNEVKGILI